MGLGWTSTKLSKKAIFMNMTIKISGSQLVTALYAKPMALYQYIPPTSCHPPGALTVGVYIVMACPWTDHILATNPLLEVEADLS